MEQKPTTIERQPGMERNLLTNFEETFKAIARVEGPGWVGVQAEILRKADEKGITDADSFIAATDRSIYGAKATLDKLTPEEREDADIVHIIEGSGGGTRYEVWADGTVKFQEHFSRANPDCIEAARKEGFEVS